MGFYTNMHLFALNWKILSFMYKEDYSYLKSYSIPKTYFHTIFLSYKK